MVEEFLKSKGHKIICGGTTAQVFARETGRELENVDDNLSVDDIPPISKINGVDLVTEGIITMNRCTELLEKRAAGTVAKERRYDAAARIIVCRPH